MVWVSFIKDRSAAFVPPALFLEFHCCYSDSRGVLVVDVGCFPMLFSGAELVCCIGVCDCSTGRFSRVCVGENGEIMMVVVRCVGLVLVVG